MDYFDKCTQDLQRLDDELVELTARTLDKKALLIRQVELASIKRMNEIVDFAFANDAQLLNAQYAFDIEHDDESNRWFAFFNNVRVSYSEHEEVFEWRQPVPENLSKLYDYQKNALAVQIYLIANYIDPDPVCAKFYDTSKISNQQFVSLHTPWWYSRNQLVSFAPLKKILRAKIRRNYERRTQHLVDWVARTQLQRIYRPGSRLYARVEREFNLTSK